MRERERVCVCVHTTWAKSSRLLINKRFNKSVVTGLSVMMIIKGVMVMVMVIKMVRTNFFVLKIVVLTINFDDDGGGSDYDETDIGKLFRCFRY